MKRIVLCGALLLLINPVAFGEDWPGFRGPSRQGISQETDAPVHWVETNNVVWKTPIPGVGYSSPIVYDGRIYLTTATEEGVSLRLLCLNAQTGRIYWDKEVIRQKAGHKQVHNSYATPTPLTDGERIYVLAEDGTLLGLSMDGEEVWRHREFEYYSEHGIAVSPILHDGLVIVPFDGSSSGPDPSIGWQTPWDKGMLLAVDARTGEVRWRGKRGMSRIAHVAPQTVEVDGKTQVVSGAGDVIQGFDAETGERLWTVRTTGEGLVPSVVVGNGLIFTTTGWSDDIRIMAVRVGGVGDSTDTHVAWYAEDDVPMVPSLLYVDPHLYALTERGVMTCFEAATGEVVWRERLRGRYAASPLWVDGYIYCLSEQGKTTVIRAGAAFEVVAENELAKGTYKAGIAVSGGQVFVRSNDALYAIRDSN